MKDYTVPILIQSTLEDRARVFCMKNGFPIFFVDARGKFIYLACERSFDMVRLGRLTYLGDPEKMEFALYRFSKNKYVPAGLFTPGSDLLDGTIEGAIAAIMVLTRKV